MTTIVEVLQDRVLSCMAQVPGFMTIAAQHVKGEYFDGAPRKNICKIMVDFWKDYGTLVTSPAFSLIIRELIKDGRIKEIELKSHLEQWKRIKDEGVSDWKFTLDELVSFIKHQRIKALINDSVSKHLPKGNFGEIEREMAKIAGISIANATEAYDYFSPDAIADRQRAREHELKTGKASISTGIKALDDMLHAKGFYQKELYIFMAPPKRGKTMSLLWFSNQAAMQGYNVLHFTCEVSREVCAKRLDAMNTKTLIREVNQYSAAVADRMATAIPSGKLFLEEYPTKTLTPDMIEARINQIVSELGVKIDMVTVDYLDICRLPQADKSAPWADQGPLAEQLRGIAGKYCIPVVTATQTNRSAAGKASTSGKDVAGDYGKIMIADEIFSFSATDEELKEGKLRISNKESRNSETGTIVISTGYEYGRFYTEFLCEEV